jgi:hypothetical protein
MNSRRIKVALGAFGVVLMAASAGAQCLTGAWSGGAKGTQAEAGTAHLIRAGYQPVADDLVNPLAPIIGMWHVKFTAATVSNGVPFGPGTEFDAGYQQWHSDGTEMLNSGGRPPATSSFCMGVWSQIGLRTFKLNHFAISWNGTRTGPTSIVEEVTVAPNGKTFSGNFTITDYLETDMPSGSSISVQDTITGTITGTRMDVNTPASPIF